jgi:hypothetical protein
MRFDDLFADPKAETRAPTITGVPLPAAPEDEPLMVPADARAGVRHLKLDGMPAPNRADSDAPVRPGKLGSIADQVPEHLSDSIAIRPDRWEMERRRVHPEVEVSMFGDEFARAPSIVEQLGWSRPGWRRREPLFQRRRVEQIADEALGVLSRAKDRLGWALDSQGIPSGRSDEACGQCNHAQRCPEIMGDYRDSGELRQIPNLGTCISRVDFHRTSPHQRLRNVIGFPLSDAHHHVQR